MDQLGGINRSEESNTTEVPSFHDAFEGLFDGDMTIALPLEKVPDTDFDTLEEGEKYLFAFSQARGFAVRKDSRSVYNRIENITKRQNYCCTLATNRSWKQPAEGARKRMKISKSEGCPCRFCLTFFKNTGRWKLRQYKGEQHNHEPTSAQDIPLTRRRERAQTGILDTISTAPENVTRRELMELVCSHHPSVTITPRDIENERNKLKRKARESATPNQQRARQNESNKVQFIKTPTQNKRLIMRNFFHN